MQIRALQSQLDRRETHVKHASQFDSSCTEERLTKEHAASDLDIRDMAADLKDFRQKEVQYKQQLQQFLAEYKKRGPSS